MAEQKLIISATTPDGLDASKTISSINPDATNAQLAQFGQKVTALTDNTYGKTDRVITINCDTESGGGAKTQATITLMNESETLANVKTALTSNINLYNLGMTYDGDGQLYAFVSSSPTNYVAVSNPTNSMAAPTTYYCRIASGNNADIVPQIVAPIVITIRADETDNYTAAEATFTITA